MRPGRSEVGRTALDRHVSGTGHGSGRSARRWLAVSLALAVAAPATLAAQTNGSGATFLLLPLGARLVGQGGAGVADRLGGESVIVNPAALALGSRSEIALLHAQDVVGTRDMLQVVIPSRALGTFGVSGYLLNLGEQPVTAAGSGQQIGTAYPRYVFLQGSYASTLGRRLALGLTFRVMQFRTDCTGECSQPEDPSPISELTPTTSMVDVGGQYAVDSARTLVLGAALRHLGPRLQVQDEEQADPLPTQVAVGARYVVPGVAQRVPGAELRLHAEVTQPVGPAGGDTGVRLGTEGRLRDTFVVRAGFSARTGGNDGPSIGFGYDGRRVGFDVARQLTGFSVEAGEPPTFVGLRYRF